MRLIDEKQWDTIYHEHFSYLSFTTAGARVRGARAAPVRRRGAADARRLAAHLRLPRRRRRASRRPSARRSCSTARTPPATRASRPTPTTARRVAEDKRRILETLIELKREGKRIVGYGAPAKGNTLLNYCGIGPDFLDYTVDLNPHKQGHLLPGTHIPIRAPEAIAEDRPDVVFILPWNLKDEIVEQLALHPRLGRDLRGAHAGARAAVVKLRRDAARRGVRRRARAAARRARLVRAHVRRRDVRRARAGRSRVASATRRSTSAPGRCAACTSRRSRTARRSSCAARAAPCTTCSSTCGPSRRRFRRWFGLELREGGTASLFAPAGLAHGFQTLEDASEVHYQMGHHYVPEAARGVRWDDPAFGIEWPAAAAGRSRRSPSATRLSGLRAVSRVLVTGASGFIGRHIAAAARTAGDEVHAVGRRAGYEGQATSSGTRPTCSSRCRRGADREVRPDPGCSTSPGMREHGQVLDRARERPLGRGVPRAAARVRCGGRRACRGRHLRRVRLATGRWHLRRGTTPLRPRRSTAPRSAGCTRSRRRSRRRRGFELAWGRVFFLYGPDEQPGRLASSVAAALVPASPRATTRRHAGARLPARRRRRRRRSRRCSAATWWARSTSGRASGVAVRDVVEEIARAAGRPELVELGALPQRPGEPLRSSPTSVGCARTSASSRASGCATAWRRWCANCARRREPACAHGRRAVGEARAAVLSLSSGPRVVPPLRARHRLRAGAAVQGVSGPARRGPVSRPCGRRCRGRRHVPTAEMLATGWLGHLRVQR